jgi:hypothetical protein
MHYLNELRIRRVSSMDFFACVIDQFYFSLSGAKLSLIEIKF